MKKKKVLFILHMPPPIHGAAIMGKYIYDSNLINERFESHYLNLSIASNLNDIQKFGAKKLFRYIVLLLKIIVQVIIFRPDLVYFTPNACGKPFYKEFPIMVLLKLMGRRVVAHYHNKGVSTYSDRWFDNILYRIFFYHTKVILLSERLYPDFSKYVRRDDVQICPNGIPATEMLQYERKEDNKKVPLLLFLSNLIPTKGVWVLLDALKDLDDRGLEFRCIFAGGESADISSEFFKKSIKERGLSHKVTYWGPAYQQEKIQLFKKADIFVFPTYYPGECFPLVLLEAMQAALPCITTSEGGILDIVHDGVNGVICKSKDPKALSLSIENMLLDKYKREKMGQTARDMFNQNFVLDKFYASLTNSLLWAEASDVMER